MITVRYVMAGLLLWNLNKRVVLLPPQLKDLRVNRFLKSGVALYLFDLILEVTLNLCSFVIELHFLTAEFNLQTYAVANDRWILTGAESCSSCGLDIINIHGSKTGTRPYGCSPDLQAALVCSSSALRFTCSCCPGALNKLCTYCVHNSQGSAVHIT
jgi:hypothetical protein